MPSLGIWRQTGSNTFSYTIKEYIYDSSGNLNGFIIPDDSVTLSATGNSYSTVAHTGIWTAQGTLLFVIQASANATRMTFPPY